MRLILKLTDVPLKVEAKLLTFLAAEPQNALQWGRLTSNGRTTEAEVELETLYVPKGQGVDKLDDVDESHLRRLLDALGIFPAKRTEEDNFGDIEGIMGKIASDMFVTGTSLDASFRILESLQSCPLPRSKETRRALFAIVDRLYRPTGERCSPEKARNWSMLQRNACERFKD